MTRQIRAFLDKKHTVCPSRGFAKVKTVSVLCKKLLNELASGVESSFQLGCSQVVNHMVLKLLETDQKSLARTLPSQEQLRLRLYLAEA